MLDKQRCYNDTEGRTPLLHTEMDPIEEEDSKPLWKNILHECVIFLIFFSSALTSNCTKNLYLDRACELNLNHTLQECNGNNTDLTDKAQAIASNYIFYSKLMHTAPPVLLALMAGPWSDKYGRKPIVYCALLCSMASAGSMTLYVLANHAPLYYTLIAEIPLALFGKKLMLMGNMYAIASDSVGAEMRTMKIVLLQIAMKISHALGTLVSGVLFKYFSYPPAFILSYVCDVIVIWIFYFVKDKGSVIQASVKTKVKDFFSFDGIKENVKVAIEKRKGSGRTQIILLYSTMAGVSFSQHGFHDIELLFCKKMFHWTFTNYTMVLTVWDIGRSFFMILCIPLLIKCLKIEDAWLGVLGVLSLQAQSVVTAFSYLSWMFYIALALGISNSVPSMIVHSKLSKIVDATELAKVFSALTIMDMLIPELSSLVYTQLYKASLGFFPGIPFLVGTVVLVFPLIVLIWLSRFEKTKNQLNEV